MALFRSWFAFSSWKLLLGDFLVCLRYARHGQVCAIESQVWKVPHPETFGWSAGAICKFTF
jgi:hypothetical protein